MAASTNFSAENDEKLIELVQQNPPIYDTSLDSYKNGVIRENIWKDVGKALNKSGEYLFLHLLEKKVKSL